MKILICPDSFKGTMTSREACNAISEGLIRQGVNRNNITLQPIADGGEGTLSCLASTLNIELLDVDTKNPLGEIIRSKVGFDQKNKIGFIEMATTSGLTLINQKERNPFETTTYGVGEQILQLLNLDCHKIYIGIGGSATNDGGIGMAQALGINFLDGNKKPIQINIDQGYSCKSIEDLENIDLSDIHRSINKTEIIVMSDVDNPLLGEKGASFIYAEQKGASKNDLEKLDNLLTKLSQVVKEDIKIEMDNIKGGGAAGGLGAGLVAFLNAKIKPGLITFANLINLENKIIHSDIVITGEGMMDGQTEFGKAPYAILEIAKKHNKKVYALNGFLEKKPSGFDKVYGTNSLVSFDPNNIKKNAKNLLIDLSQKFASDVLN